MSSPANTADGIGLSADQRQAPSTQQWAQHFGSGSDIRDQFGRAGFRVPDAREAFG